MISCTSRRFRQCFEKLPVRVQVEARDAFRFFQINSSYQSLNFKKVHSNEPIYSVRINLNYRALGRKEGDEMIWFWIGSHDDYEKLLNNF